MQEDQLSHHPRHKSLGEWLKSCPLKMSSLFTEWGENNSHMIYFILFMIVQSQNWFQQWLYGWLMLPQYPVWVDFMHLSASVVRLWLHGRKCLPSQLWYFNVSGHNIIENAVYGHRQNIAHQLYLQLSDQPRNESISILYMWYSNLYFNWQNLQSSKWTLLHLVSHDTSKPKIY